MSIVMSNVDRWLLPDGVEDILPSQAKELEFVRRRLLDLFAAWGYQYVIPPMVEFLESLLTGTGRDLDLKTFKVTDLVSGRTMGIRADLTPQVARMDAHVLNRDGATRLCYAGTVLHSQADNMLASRTPVKVGAELFGESNREADLEIVSLMVESLQVLKVQSLHLELGDVSIYQELVGLARLSAPLQEELFAMVQRKAFAEIDQFVSQLSVSEPPVSEQSASEQSVSEPSVSGQPIDSSVAELLRQLPSLCGDASVLPRSKVLFAQYPTIISRLENLEWLVERLAARFPEVNIYCDLSELRGYNYHTGIVFAAYVAGSAQALAKGGRYDHIGEVFGRRRGATGFDVVLHNLPAITTALELAAKQVIVRASTDATDDSRWQKIQALRSEGYIVVESGDLRNEFDYELEYDSGTWILNKIDRE